MSNLIYPKTLKLKSGKDLLGSLKAIAKEENKSGYILSVVGDLSKSIFKCPGKKQSTIIEKHLEIISLNGLISPNKSHLHICFSDVECNVWAGHLEEGTLILSGADILIGFLYENLGQNEVIVNKQKVEIFVLPDCPWSSRAIRMLRTLQVEHEIKVIKNDNDFEALNKISKNSSFPQIFIKGKFIGGYSELAELHAAGKLTN